MPDNVFVKYQDNDAKRKVLQFARAFLRYMAKISFDQRYAAFDWFLQLPRAIKEQKRVKKSPLLQKKTSVLRVIAKNAARKYLLSIWDQVAADVIYVQTALRKKTSVARVTAKDAARNCLSFPE